MSYKSNIKKFCSKVKASTFDNFGSNETDTLSNLQNTCLEPPSPIGDISIYLRDENFKISDKDKPKTPNNLIVSPNPKRTVPPLEIGKSELLGYNKRYPSSKATLNELSKEDKKRFNNLNKLYRLVTVTNPYTQVTRFYYVEPFFTIPPTASTGTRYRLNLKRSAKNELINSIKLQHDIYGNTNHYTFTQRDSLASNSYQYKAIQDKLIRKLREHAKYNSEEYQKFKRFDFSWRCEAQKNNNLHTHFATPCTINFIELTRIWNEAIMYALDEKRKRKLPSGKYISFYDDHLKLIEKGTDDGTIPIWRTLTAKQIQDYKLELSDYLDYLERRRAGLATNESKVGMYKYLSFPHHSRKDANGYYVTKDHRTGKDLKLKGNAGLGLYMAKDSYETDENDKIIEKTGVLIQGNVYYISNEIRSQVKPNRTDWGVHTKQELDEYIKEIEHELRDTPAYVKTYKSRRNDQRHGTIKLISDCIENLFDNTIEQSRYIDKNCYKSSILYFANSYKPPEQPPEQPPERVRLNNDKNDVK